MSDTPTPSSTEKTVIVNSPNLGRLWTLTITSLVLNGLILFLILLGIVIHHHPPKRPGFGGGPANMRFCPMGGFDPRFARFGGPPGPGWGGPQGMMPPGPGMMPGGPGPGPMRDMMGGPKGPPDPAKMTDNVLDMLTSKLTLTDDQKAKLKPIIANQVAQFQKQMEAQRAAMQKQIEDAKALIKPLLNADQQKQLDALPLPGQKPPDATPGE